MRFLTPAIVCLTIGFAAPAAAGIQVCNKTEKTAWVAIAYDQVDVSSMASSISWGWWKVEPGACALTISQPLEIDGSASYYAAVRDDGGFWRDMRQSSEGSASASSVTTKSFCTKPIDDFQMAELHSLRNTPPLCERRDYFLLETDRQANFTITLVPQ